MQLKRIINYFKGDKMMLNINIRHEFNMTAPCDYTQVSFSWNKNGKVEQANPTPNTTMRQRQRL